VTPTSAGVPKTVKANASSTHCLCLSDANCINSCTPPSLDTTTGSLDVATSGTGETDRDKK
jgi:hypothetical protein